MFIFETETKTCFLLRFIVCCWFTAVAAIASGQPMQQFLFTHLGIRDGLASDETMAVQQDKTGYIWIATLDGLQRYDGKRLYTFRSSIANDQSIPNDMVKQVLLDKQDRLWLCCSENRVGFFNVSDFTFHEAAVRFPKETVATTEGRLFTDNNGRIMLLLAGAGVFTYNESRNEFAAGDNPFRVPDGWKINWITQDQLRNNYWIACDSGLVKFNPAKKTLSYRGQNTDDDEIIAAFAHLHWVNTPYIDKSGRCWLLAWPTKEQTFFYSYDPAIKKTTEWASQFNRLLANKYYFIHTIKEQKDGTIWVIGGNLFARLNKQGTAFEMIPHNLPGEFSIRYDGVKQLYEDREDNLWACTNNGLFRFNPAAQLFHVILNKRLNKDSVYGSDVTDILQTKDGNILVSTWGNGLFPYDKNFNPINVDFVNQSQRLGENLTWCIHQRSNGDIWRGNQYGTLFISYCDAKQTEKIQPPVFEGKTIRQIAEDSSGNLWLATVNGHLVKWSAANNQFLLIRKFGSNIERLYADQKGWLWVCTRGNGLYKVNVKDGSVAGNYTAGGPEGRKLMKPYAMDIIAYDDSLYFIASGGVNVLNTNANTIRFLVKNNTYPTNNISNLIKDTSGKVWITSLGGLGTIDLKLHITSSYDQRDGVHTNNFNGGSTTMLNDGRIAIGTSHDLLVFDPTAIHIMDMPLPDIVITGFVLMNKALRIDSLNKLKNIELQYDKNSVIIEFSTLTYQNNFGISYMLEGLDKTWRDDDGSNRAIYTYLPHGNYTFKVKVENGNRSINIKTVTLKIRVKAPFWETWWFLSLLAFAAIGMVYSFDKFRVARIRETERIRTRIATSLTKDMTNTLSNINVLSELARVKLDKDTERTREYIGQISDNSHRMMEVMDDMIWSINPENDELKYTILRMKKYASEIQSRYNLEICFTVDKKVDEVKLQMDRRHEMFLIYKEALLNSGKHGNSKFADVDIRLEKSKLKMSISDNGNGFDTEATSFGRGLNEMRKKAATLNALLQIRSKENTGTEVKLEMNL
ncbi:MAG: hypothetical protein JWP81_1959 [Ferruginibacter sp.]|nr:hypothetical protein [Ferruginibacter sp.]